MPVMLYPSFWLNSTSLPLAVCWSCCFTLLIYLNIPGCLSGHSHFCLTLTSRHTYRCWMACPQWTAMSQLPASIPTILPPKCRLTWGTAAPRRPMWPAPHGSHPVAVLSLPTAVTSLPRWLLRVWPPPGTPCTLSLPLLSDLKQEDSICGTGLPRKAIPGWTNVSPLIYL